MRSVTNSLCQFLRPRCMCPFFLWYCNILKCVFPKFQEILHDFHSLNLFEGCTSHIWESSLTHRSVMDSQFLSSANEVSTGPTCQSLYLCFFVSLFVCTVFFSRHLIGWYTGFWQWFWHPTYPTRCFELGWAVPYSDFLAWLSSATLKIFI